MPDTTIPDPPPPDPAVADAPSTAAEADFVPPPGNHPLEVAARQGIGPLSPAGSETWHGNAQPCVSCGQVVSRDVGECSYCGQDLRAEMLDKMRAHAGPWYVFEHVRPFPGVSLERIVRQIQRGLLTETSIIRGPTTHHQWRFATETPGVCRCFGRCWNCHATVAPSDSHCKSCQVNLSVNLGPIERPPSSATAVAIDLPQPTAPPSTHDTAPKETGDWAEQHLKELSAALNQAEAPKQEDIWDSPPRIAGISATWVIVGIIIAVVIALMVFTQSRNQLPAQTLEPAAKIVAPAATPTTPSTNP